MGITEQVPFSEEVNDNKKFCADCKTTKTPLRRGGPSGPKSLCNACGIRYRKRIISIPGMRREAEDERERTLIHGTWSSSQETVSKCDGNESGNQSNEPLKVGLVVSVRVGVLSKPASKTKAKKQRRQRKLKLGEEERAAVSLMALSCASVFG